MEEAIVTVSVALEGIVLVLSYAAAAALLPPPDHTLELAIIPVGANLDGIGLARHKGEKVEELTTPPPLLLLLDVVKVETPLFHTLGVGVVNRLGGTLVLDQEFLYNTTLVVLDFACLTRFVWRVLVVKSTTKGRFFFFFFFFFMPALPCPCGGICADDAATLLRAQVFASCSSVNR